jgi:hypothetical protein
MRLTFLLTSALVYAGTVWGQSAPAPPESPADSHPPVASVPAPTPTTCPAAEGSLMADHKKEYDAKGKTLNDNQLIDVKENYFRIIYNVSTGELFWYDPKTGKRGHDENGTITLLQNNLFPPVMYSDQRILVTICDAHFGADLSTSASATTIAEVNPIRNGSAAAATPMMMTALDGHISGLSEVMLAIRNAAEPAPPTEPNSPPADPDEAAKLATNAVQYYTDRNQLLDDLRNLNCSPAGDPPCTSDSLQGVSGEVSKLKDELQALNADQWNMQGAFAAYATRTQQSVAKINNLNGAISQADLRTRVAKLNKEFKAFADELQADLQPQNQATYALAQSSVDEQLSPSKIGIKDIGGLDPRDAVLLYNGLSADLRNLRNNAYFVFTQMNTWHDNSLVSITDIVKPVPGNAVITLKILVHDAYVPFGFAGVTQKPSSDPSKQQNNQKASSADGTSPSTSSDQYEVRRVLIEVHRTATFNLVGGFSASVIPQRAYGLRPAPPVGNPPVILQVPYQSQNQPLQFNALTGINWYAFGKRDYFPGYSTWRYRLKHPGLLLATTVTSLGNVMGGVNFEPASGVDVYGGLAVGQETHLGPGIILGVTQFGASATSVPTRQTLTPGAFFGVGFDIGTFATLFSKSSAPTSTASH